MNSYRIKSYSHIYMIGRKSSKRKLFYLLFGILVLLLFMPWTQNIRAKGQVTTIYQDQRPQEINTIIGGRVIKWHVNEGDFVKQGDTLLQLEEVKVDYLDPNLLGRTREQLDEKKISVNYYQDKAGTAGLQIDAINQSLKLKLEQLDNKILQLEYKRRADSADVIAAGNDLKIASIQFNRQKSLYDSGLVSLTQLEQRNIQYQQASAKKISADNRLANTKQELIIVNIEKSALWQEFLEKTAKARGDQLQSLSEMAGGKAEIAKLQNLYSSYSIRNGMYIIRAPQSGQVTRVMKSGIGEFVKEGEIVGQIVPEKQKLLVEVYVRPVDLPLLQPGQKIRFLFDGFPAVVFSGWPKASTGTFGGLISSIDGSVSPNGKFRVLIKEDPEDRPWPKELKVGTGANAIALLNDVPLWYELWRNINGFPPDYYKHQSKK